MAVEAKPYKEGKGWAIRVRYKGVDFHLSGFKTEGARSTSARYRTFSVGQPDQLRLRLANA